MRCPGSTPEACVPTLKGRNGGQQRQGAFEIALKYICHSEIPDQLGRILDPFNKAIFLLHYLTQEF
jgi:hypothetical protein